LLTLKPEELDEEITKKFEVLGIEIPDMKYVICHMWLGLHQSTVHAQITPS